MNMASVDLSSSPSNNWISFCHRAINVLRVSFSPCLIVERCVNFFFAFILLVKCVRKRSTKSLKLWMEPEGRLMNH